MKPIILKILTLLLFTLPAFSAPTIRVMLLDGESGGPYHKWQLITPVLKKQLEETGLFQVDVVTAPPANGDYSNFKPEFTKYQVIVMNYDAPDERWPAELKASFEKYISGGGGLVIVHAANNAFGKWKEFNEMIGIGGWRGRDETSGALWFFKDGKLTSDNSPGKAGNHGARLPYQIVMRDTTHPIAKGLPKVWMHQGDELYTNLRGPGKNMNVLGTAFADPSNRGTNRDEPLLMTLTYGKGKIFHTAFGHDIAALSCVGAITMLQRGTEWAATGKVTQKVPANFPTANSVSYRTDYAAMDPNYKKGLNGFDR